MEARPRAMRSTGRIPSAIQAEEATIHQHKAVGLGGGAANPRSVLEGYRVVSFEIKLGGLLEQTTCFSVSDQDDRRPAAP